MTDEPAVLLESIADVVAACWTIHKGPDDLDGFKVEEIIKEASSSSTSTFTFPPDIAELVWELILSRFKNIQEPLGVLHFIDSRVTMLQIRDRVYGHLPAMVTSIEAALPGVS